MDGEMQQASSEQNGQQRQDKKNWHYGLALCLLFGVAAATGLFVTGPGPTAFETPQELKDAVDKYVLAANPYMYQPIGTWDVSRITDFSRVFSRRERIGTPPLYHSFEEFNDDLNGWDVSQATNMSWMFAAAHSFNGDISN